MFEEFPKMLYQVDGEGFANLTVESAEAEAEARAQGWGEITPLADDEGAHIKSRRGRKGSDA